MTDVAAGEIPVVAAPASPTRLLFIDNIRWSMILLVLSMHASDTYSPFGNWYYTDRGPETLGTALAFGTYQSFLQAFFMALLFFIAGYFTPPSYDKRPGRAYLLGRFMRLGLPTLLYMLVIGPFTQYFLSHSWGDGGFLHQWMTHLKDGQWLSETGPMWFCAVLLLFCFGYALLRATQLAASDTPIAHPTRPAVALFILVMALATFLVRIRWPDDVSILNVHVGDLPPYVMMFAAGILAQRGRWLETVPDASCARRAAFLLGLAAPLFAVLILFGGALQGHTAAYSGGANLVSLGKNLWEAMICIGMSYGLIALYRRSFTAQGRIARLLSDNAFAVYVFHPPVLIALALAIHPLVLPPLAKAALLTLLAALATFTLSALILRRIPGLARIL